MTTLIRPSDALSIAERSKNDPVWFTENILGVKPWGKQKDVLRAVARHNRVSVRSCSSAGKSKVASCVICWFAYNFDNFAVITTAPTWRQVEDILWREVAICHNHSRVRLGGFLTKTKLAISDKRFALGLSTDEPERFQGFHNENVLVVVDEASGVTEEIFRAVENPMSSGNAHLLLISNPTQPTGGFMDSFLSPFFHKISISAFDTPNFVELGIGIENIRDGSWEKLCIGKELPYPSLVTPRWVRERLEEWGENSYNWDVYVMGEFPNVGEDNLFSLRDVEWAMSHEVSGDPDEVVCALDVARYGEDESVFATRHGNRILQVQTWLHKDTMYSVGRTMRYIRQSKPRLVNIDAVGVGAGVYDRLLEEGVSVDSINVGEKAVDEERFANRRAELYWLLSRKLAGHEISLPDDPRLKGQLADIKYRYNSHGKLVIESKEEARSRGSKSPDRVDAVVMLFAKAEYGRAMNRKPVSFMKER